MRDNVLMQKRESGLQKLVLLGADVTVLQPRVDGTRPWLRPGRGPLQLPEAVPANELSFLNLKKN